MKLYVVRHGSAMSNEQDAERPLTPSGLKEVRRVGAYLKRAQLVTASEIQHSTKLRARQTARALAETIGLGVPVTQVPNLEPLSAVADLAGALSGTRADLMLVGHLPHLNRLASLLVAGDADGELFSFSECGVILLRRREGGARNQVVWTVEWMFGPELAI